MKPMFTNSIRLQNRSVVRLLMPALFLFFVQCLNAQNVGIGTTSPIAKLHVMGDSKFQSGNMDLSGNSINNVNGLNAATLTIGDVVNFSGVSSFTWPSYTYFNGVYASELAASGLIDFSGATSFMMGSNFGIDLMSDVDVSTTSPTDGDVLTYSSGQWVPMATGGGGGGDVSFNNLTANSGASVDFSQASSITFPQIDELEVQELTVLDGLEVVSGEVDFGGASSIALPLTVEVANLEVWNLEATGSEVDLSGASSINLGSHISIDAMNDVDVSTTPPADGNVLTYDENQGAWVPMAGGGSGSGGAISFTSLEGQPNATVDLSALSQDAIVLPSYVYLENTSMHIGNNFGVTGTSFLGNIELGGAFTIDGYYGSVDFSGGTVNLGSIENLSDVDVISTPPNDGEVLTWSASSSQWAPSTPAAPSNLSFNSLSANSGATVDFSALSSTGLTLPSYVDFTGVDANFNSLSTNGQSYFGGISLTMGSSLTVGNNVNINFDQASSSSSLGSINLMNDVDVTGVSNGDVLTWSNSLSQWVPMASSSDVRFKKDIQPLSNSLSKVLKLRGVEYNWRKDEFPNRHFQDKHQIGFIAQELEKVYPDLVNTDEEGYKSVDYQKMGPILVEAIKDQQSIINAQQTELAELKARVEKAEAATDSVSELMSRLEKLEAAVSAANNPLTSKE